MYCSHTHYLHNSNHLNKIIQILNCCKKHKCYLSMYKKHNYCHQCMRYQNISYYYYQLNYTKNTLHYCKYQVYNLNHLYNRNMGNIGQQLSHYTRYSNYFSILKKHIMCFHHILLSYTIRLQYLNNLYIRY